MGGRGAWSASTETDMRDGGGLSGGKWDKSHPAVTEPTTLKEAIGEKGRPMGIVKAFEGANPFFSPFYREFSENCQRAVVAYELRRRGYKVTAQPTYEHDALPMMIKGTGNGFWQGAFKGAKSEKIGASSTEKARANLKAKMKEYGAGARAIVYVDWKSGGAHVFNAENIGGRIVFVDAQVGTRYNSKTILNGTISSHTRIIRTDNLRISDRAKKSVWTEGA